MLLQFLAKFYRFFLENWKAIENSKLAGKMLQDPEKQMTMVFALRFDIPF